MRKTSQYLDSAFRYTRIRACEADIGKSSATNRAWGAPAMCRQGGDEVDVPIAIVSVDSQADQPEATMTRAYQALYAAKREGRDRARWH